MSNSPNFSPAPDALRCSVVVPVFHGRDHFRACLESIATALRSGDELIVIASGESDGAWRIAHEFGAQVEILPINRGAGFARNAGARAASGDFIFFVDADVTVPP